VDGPEFDGHLVDWDLLMARQRIYLTEEGRAKEEWLAGEHTHGHGDKCRAEARLAEEEGS
jgi:ferredoxin--NADP+ reductase